MKFLADPPVRYLVALVFVMPWYFCALADVSSSGALRISSARSAKDMGLADALANKFKEHYPGVNVEIESGGVLKVLDDGRKGKADIVITHHQPEEQRFAKQGYSLYQSQFAYTEYALFGPPGDPLQLSSEKDLVAVFRKLAREEVEFYAPSPQSGTNMKIEEIWTMTGENPDWLGYENTGVSGYGTLLQAAEFGYYTVAEMATYISNKHKFQGRIIPLYRDDINLRNIYSVSVIDPGKVKGVNSELAVAFYEFLVSETGQGFIREFAEKTLQSTVLSPAAHLDASLRARISRQQLDIKAMQLKFAVVISLVMFLMLLTSAVLFFRVRRAERKHNESKLKAQALEIAQVEILKANELLQQEIIERRATEERLSSVIDKLNTSENELKKYQNHLEILVKSRTNELENAINELQAFSYSVSHDLRSPLRSINGFSRALLEDYESKLNPEAVDFIKRVVNASERMDQLIDGLLQLSRITRQDVKITSLNLSRMAGEILDSVDFGKNERNVSVEIEENLVIDGDKNLVRVLMQNLLTNAIKYTSTREDAKISIGKEVQGRETVFYVRDNGVGFSMEYANRIFRPFQRLHAESEFSGSGIGLSTVQRIIQRHGGKIWAESELEGGATFYFSLPVNQVSVVSAVSSGL